MITSCKAAYCRLISIGDCLQAFLLLAMRLYWGGSLMLAGWGKVQHIGSTSDFFASLGIPFAFVNAYLVGYIELVGGACLVLGFASRLVCIPIMCVMLVALLTAHQPALINALQAPKELIAQPPFTYLLTVLIVFAFGPGKISVDYLIERFCCPPSGKK
jgi:putative oxidoreductase